LVSLALGYLSPNWTRTLSAVRPAGLLRDSKMLGSSITWTCSPSSCVNPVSAFSGRYFCDLFFWPLPIRVRSRSFKL